MKKDGVKGVARRRIERQDEYAELKNRYHHVAEHKLKIWVKVSGLVSNKIKLLVKHL